jgi:hypothetical protein
MYEVERLLSRDLYRETWVIVSRWETMSDAYCDLMARRDDGETVRIKEGGHE